MAIPATPTNPYLQQGNGQVLLSWDIISGATSYQVQRSPDGVTFTNLATSLVNQYLDTTALLGVNYYYQVASVNASGTSSYTTPQNIVATTTGQMALGAIRLLAQQKADRVGSNYVTLPEWNSYINNSYFELYDMLVTLYEEYYLAPQALFQTNGSQFYSLPDGVTTFMNSVGGTFIPQPFYKLTGVDCGLALSNNAWVTLKKFNFVERNRYVYPNISSTIAYVSNMQYRVEGNNLMFIPTPSSGQYIRLWYIPRMTQLLKDTDIADGVSGWIEYVAVDAAIKALIKEESDVTALGIQKQMLIDRIQSTAMNRDSGMPDTISDTRNWGARYGSPNGDGSSGGY